MWWIPVLLTGFTTVFFVRQSTVALHRPSADWGRSSRVTLAISAPYERFKHFCEQNSTILRWKPGVASCAFEHIVSDGHQWCPTNLKDSHAVNCHSSKRKMVMATCGVLLLDENGEARCPATHKCFGSSKTKSKNLWAKWKNLKVLRGRWGSH